MMHKNFPSPGYRASRQFDEEHRKREAFMLLFLLDDEEIDVTLDSQVLELAQQQLSRQRPHDTSYSRRPLPPRRHLRR